MGHGHPAVRLSDGTKEEEYKGEVITQDQATNSSQSQTEAAATEATAPAATTPVIDKSTIKIKILNGNGVSGSAASVRNQLTGSGFSVAAITNAKTFSYQTTIIYYHTGKEAEATLVKDAVTGKETALELSDTVTTQHDVVVVVGKK